MSSFLFGYSSVACDFSLVPYSKLCIMQFMRVSASLICLVFAFVLFAIAGFAWTPPFEPWRVKLIALGLTAYTLHLLLTHG